MSLLFWLSPSRWSFGRVRDSHQPMRALHLGPFELRWWDHPRDYRPPRSLVTSMRYGWVAV